MSAHSVSPTSNDADSDSDSASRQDSPAAEPSAAGSAKAPADQINLALSGGGFRAALFHLGVLRYLYDAKVLKNVHQIASVSGGSILAALFVLRWDEATCDEGNEVSEGDGFEKVSTKLIEFAQCDVRGWVLRRWMMDWMCVVVYVLFMLLLWAYDVGTHLELPRLWQIPLHPAFVLAVVTVWITHKVLRRSLRTRLLVRSYNNMLLGKKPPVDGTAHPRAWYRQGDLADDERPDLYLQATSMNSGESYSIHKEGVTQHSGVEKQTPDPIKTSRIQVAEGIAASSAFPPLFPPFAINITAQPRPFDPPHLFTDGGVYDNSGACLIRSLEFTAPAITIVSNAGKPFTPAVRRINLLKLLPWRITRTTNIQMKRLLDTDLAVPRSGESFLNIESNIETEDSTLLGGIDNARKIPQFRTDLDRFNATECRLLIQHGWLVAKNELSKRYPTRADLWEPECLKASASTEAPEIEKALKHSERPRVSIWRLSDPFASTALVLIALLSVVLAVGCFCARLPSTPRFLEFTDIGLYSSHSGHHLDEEISNRPVLRTLRVALQDGAQTGHVFRGHSQPLGNYTWNHSTAPFVAKFVVKGDHTVIPFVFRRRSETDTLESLQVDPNTLEFEVPSGSSRDSLLVIGHVSPPVPDSETMRDVLTIERVER